MSDWKAKEQGSESWSSDAGTFENKLNSGTARTSFSSVPPSAFSLQAIDAFYPRESFHRDAYQPVRASRLSSARALREIGRVLLSP